MSQDHVKTSAAAHGAAIRPYRDSSVTHLKLYALLLIVVFTFDALETWLTPYFFPFISTLPHLYYDPFLTTLFIAPFLWWLVVRPLQKGALEEKARHDAIKAQVVDAVVTVDPEGVIISFNPAAERIFGYRPEEILGRDAAGLFCDIQLSGENLAQLASNSGQDVPKIHEVSCNTKDGRPLRLEISVSCLEVDNKAQFLVIMRDITARVRMEKETRELQSRLIQSNKMSSLGLMVSGVAHEINNPNNYILANAQLLERSCADIIKVMREYQQENGDFLVGGIPFPQMEKHFPEMISAIIDGTQRINLIINDLKMFTRKEGGGQLEAIDINQAVKSAVVIVKSQIELHTKNFTMDLADNLPKAMGDSQQVGQVVINLLVNACQSLHDENDAVCLKTGYDASSDMLDIMVVDEGKGIPPQMASQVMEPFFSTRFNHGGTGLGLAICQSIIDSFSGRINFASMPGQGTVFRVSIPAAHNC